MNFFFQVKHGSRGHLTDHGSIGFTATSRTGGTISASPVHFPSEGPWTYTVDANMNLSATLSPPMQLTNGGDTSHPSVCYSSMTAVVTMDSNGNITSATQGFLTVAPCPGAEALDPQSDPPDSWDASASPVGGHHHHRELHNEAKA